MARRPFSLTVDRCLGVNLQPGDHALPPHYVRRAQNARHEAGSMWAKRTGSWKLNSNALGTQPAAGGLYQWMGASPSQILVVSASDGHLWTAATGIGARTFTDRGALGASAADAAFAGFYQAATPKVFIATGQVGGLASWDGATLVTGIATTPASPTALRPYLDRLFVVNNTRRLYWSKITDATAFDVASGGGFADLGVGGDDKLVGLARVGNSLLLFTRDSCARFTGAGPSNISLATDTAGVSAAFGCIAPHTIVELQDAEGIGDAVFCLTRSGPALFTEGGMTPLWDALRREWRDMSPLFAASAIAAHHRGRNEIWITITSGGSGTTNDRTWCWHYPTNSWWGPWVLPTTPTAWRALCPFVHENTGLASDGQEFVLSAAGSNVYLEDYRIGGDNRQDRATNADGTGGTAVSLAVDMAPLTGPNAFDELVLREIASLNHENGSHLAYSWSNLDGLQVGSGSGTLEGGSSTVATTHRARLNARGRRLGVTLSDAGSKVQEVHAVTFKGYTGRRS